MIERPGQKFPDLGGWRWGGVEPHHNQRKMPYLQGHRTPTLSFYTNHYTNASGKACIFLGSKLPISPSITLTAACCICGST
jgi:hypothetical protein